MQGAPGELLPAIAELRATNFRDPEGLYLVASQLPAVEPALSLELLEEVVGAGFHCAPALRGDPAWAPVREHPGFVRALEQATRAHERAAAALDRAGARAVLGPRSSSAGRT
jgi:hypothetical protein